MTVPTSDFQRAYSILMAVEGGLAGAIDPKAWPNVDPAVMTEDEGKVFFLGNYWLPAYCIYFPYPMAVNVFDMAVNQGVEFAIKTFQAWLKVEVDGVVGPVTKAAINGLANLTPTQLIEMNASLYRMRVYAYMQDDGFAQYGPGWIDRLFKVAQEI
jgi:lysozyme family protein